MNFLMVQFKNIAFGEANEKDLIESSKIAGCYDFIVKKRMALIAKSQETTVNIHRVNQNFNAELLWRS